MAVVVAVEAIVDGVGAVGVEEGTVRMTPITAEVEIMEEDQIIIIMEGVMIDMVVLIEIIEGKDIMIVIINHASVGGMIMTTVMIDVPTIIIMIEEAHEVEIIILCTEEQIINRDGITVVMMRMIETVVVEMDIIIVNQWQNLLQRLQKSINLHQNLSKIIPLQ